MANRQIAVVEAIGRVTFFEILRDKILYNIVIFSVLLLGIGFLASKLSFARPDRVVMDFGFSALNISCALVAIFLGAGAMPRELERRTIHVALSRPISRPQFVIGKFSGLAAVLFLNWALLCGAFLTILAFSGDGLSGNFHLVTAWALFCIFLQSIVIASIAMVFSTFSTTSLSAMIAIGFYLIGNNIAQLRAVSARTRNPVTVAVLDGLTAVLPNFEYFNLSTKVTYGIPVGWKFGVVGFLYALLLTSLALGMSGFFIQRREV